MIAARQVRLVLVTTPDLKTARRLASQILQNRLAACVNLVPNLESHYWWRGTLEQAREVLLLIKTTRGQLEALESTIQESHPYDTPEIIAWPPAAASSKYLAWIQASVRGPRKRGRTQGKRGRVT